MSLDKAVQHGKEKRQKYRGAKSVSVQCRNHNACDHCRQNRKFKFNKKKEDASDER